jgi:hypothetical protein
MHNRAASAASAPCIKAGICGVRRHVRVQALTDASSVIQYVKQQQPGLFGKDAQDVQAFEYTGAISA